MEHQWEYKEVKLNPDKEYRWEQLQELGNKYWEIAVPFTLDGITTFIFKRRSQPGRRIDQ